MHQADESPVASGARKQLLAILLGFFSNFLLWSSHLKGSRRQILLTVSQGFEQLFDMLLSGLPSGEAAEFCKDVREEETLARPLYLALISFCLCHRSLGSYQKLS